MKSLVLLLSVLLSVSAWAQKKNSPPLSYSMPAVEGGFKWNSGSLRGSSSDRQKLGFQVGVSAVIDLNEKFGIKSGLFYSERPFESVDTVGTVIQNKLNYFEVPVFLMYKLEDYAGVYVGPSLGVKLSSDYAITGVKDIVVPITFGAQFKFMPNLGLNVFFETVPGELATGLENAHAVGVNLLFTLD